MMSFHSVVLPKTSFSDYSHIKPPTDKTQKHVLKYSNEIISLYKVTLQLKEHRWDTEYSLLRKVWSYKHTSRVSLSWLTAVSNSGSIVSSPGNPGGGLAPSFSATVCGAAI